MWGSSEQFFFAISVKMGVVFLKFWKLTLSWIYWDHVGIVNYFTYINFSYWSIEYYRLIIINQNICFWTVAKDCRYYRQKKVYTFHDLTEKLTVRKLFSETSNWFLFYTTTGVWNRRDDYQVFENDGTRYWH